MSAGGSVPNARGSGIGPSRDVAAWCESLHYRPDFYQDRGEATVITPNGPAFVSHRAPAALTGGMAKAMLDYYEVS